jgi:hypothetical protein
VEPSELRLGVVQELFSGRREAKSNNPPVNVILVSLNQAAPVKQQQAL